MWAIKVKIIFAAHSYDQVTNFLQGYVDNELNLNTDDSCTQNCVDYTKTKNYLCSPDTVCGETDTRHRHLSVCKGNVHDCVDIGDIDTKICHAADPVRRYNYMLFSNNELVGLPDRPCEVVSKVSETQAQRDRPQKLFVLVFSNFGRRKRGADGLSSAAVAFVCATIQVTRSDISVCMKLLRTSNKISAFISPKNQRECFFFYVFVS